MTEAWVFGDRREGGYLLRRLGPFWLMNNVLLALRGPILTLMVSAAGIHYILANLISLGAITLLRYLLADRWIWAKSSPAETANAATATSESSVVAPERRGSSVVAAPTGKTFPFAYDVHGIVQIESMVRLPELDYFRVSGTFQNADLRIWQDKRRRSRRAAPATPRSAHRDQRRQQRRAAADMHYEDGPGRYGFEVAITYKERTEIATSPLLKLSPHVLYTNVVEPILRWTFVRKGHALCHAACVSFGGQGVLITARTDTGKTTTILRSLTHHACVFLSDDMTIMGREGQVLSYPKPLTISRHTLRAVNAARLSLPERMALQVQSLLHSRSGRQIGLLLGQTKIPAASLNAIVQMIIPPPKYMVDRLVTNVKVADGAYLTNMILIERGPS
ncbi:MAG: GtrA family protein, partial [Chloroflexi bacterium]|nr:GtrA family protein [Chloroflexota bacterium]